MREEARHFARAASALLRVECNSFVSFTLVILIAMGLLQQLQMHPDCTTAHKICSYYYFPLS